MDATFGLWLDGQMDARDIQTRELGQASGIHETEISRIRNGRKAPSEKQIFQLGLAAAQLEAKRLRK